MRPSSDVFISALFSEISVAHVAKNKRTQITDPMNAGF